MDLTTLPVEMIANVFKYLKLEAVTRIRKMNQQMDRIAIQYHLNEANVYKIVVLPGKNLISVHYLDLEKWETKRVHMYYETASKPPPYNCVVKLKNDCNDILLTWQKYLKKIRCVEFEFNDVVIDEYWLKSLATYKHSKRVTVNLIDCHLKISVGQLTSVLAKYKESLIDVRQETTTLEGAFTTDGVICSLLGTVSSFKIRRIDKPRQTWLLDVTDKCLKVARTFMPTSFLLCYKTSFTLPEVIKTLKKVIVSPQKKYGIWDLGLIAIGTVTELEKAIAEFRSIENVQIIELEGAETLIIYQGAHHFLFSLTLLCEEDN